MDEVITLRRQARALPYGEARTRMLERALALATDSVDVRLELAEAYQYGAEPVKVFAVFSRLVSDYDADPGAFADYQVRALLWYYKWICFNMRRFPEIPLQRAHDALAEMERRFLLAGYGLQAVHANRCLVAGHVGDRDAAAEWFHQWRITPRDELSDCAGCDPSGQVRHLVWLGRDEEAVELAAPVLEGHLTCREQPHTILTRLLVPYVRTGRLDQAAAAHLRAYRLMQGNVDHVEDLGDHLEFLALTGNETRGLEVLRRELPHYRRSTTPGDQLSFASAGALLLGRLEGLGQHDLAELREELETRARELAAAFDARNGTAGHTIQLEGRLAAEPWVDYLPLVPHSRRMPVPQAPAVPPLKDDPDALLDQAEQAWQDGELGAAFAAWERYDQLGGARNARRLDGLGLQAVAQGDGEEAARLWLEAAELHEGEAERQSSLGRAGLLLEDGLALIEESHRYLSEYGTPEQQHAALHRLAQGYGGAGRIEDAIALLEGDEDGRSLTMLARLLTATDLARAAQVAGQARHALRERKTALAEAALLHAQILRHQGGDVDELLEAYEEALAHAPHREQGMRAAVHAMRGEVLVAVGRAGEAAEDLIEAVAAFTALGDTAQAALTRVDLATAYLATERPTEAAVAAEEALALLDPADAANRAGARWSRAHALRLLGQAEQALEDFTALVDEYDNPWQSARASDMVGKLLDGLGRDEDAASAFGVAAERFLEAGDQAAAGVALRAQTVSLFWAQDLEPALESAKRARAALEEPFELAALAYDEARILHGLGRTPEARERCAEAIDAFTSLGEDRALQTAREFLDELDD